MVDAKTLGVLYILGIGLLVTAICMLLLSLLRPKLPQVYQFRRLLNRYQKYNDFNGARVGFPSKRPQTGLFGWLGPTLATPEDEIVQRIGLDAAMFLRFVRSQLITFAIVALFCCGLLWPVYGTAGNKDLPTGNVDHVGGLQVISLSNVPVGNARLWATLIAEYVVCAVVIFFLWKDYSAYADYRREYRTAENPSNYAVVVYDIPDGLNTTEAVRERFELMVPGQVSEVVLARKARKGIKAEKMLAKMIAKRERAQLLASTTGTQPMTRPGTCGCCMLWKAKVPAVEHFTSEQERLEAVIREEGLHAENANSAIVVFSNKRAASLIAQANQGGNADEWTVHRAGEPEAVHWPAFHIPGYQAVWRSIAVLGLVFFLTFFWIIPATAIVGLANLESLSKLDAFSWLEGIQNFAAPVVGLIENALPSIILAVFLALIPTFFRLALQATRIHSHHIIDSKTRNYFYFFTIFASFIFIVLGSSVLNQIQTVINDPARITKLLAAGVPSQGLFFASFVMLKTFIPMSLMLVNPGRVIVRWLKLKMAKTERERRAAEEGGSVFPYFKMYGNCLVMSLLGICYSTLAPLVTLCVLIFFGFSFAVFKHNIVFASHRKWDGGGWDYPGAFYATVISLILKQLTMIGAIGLFESPAQSALSIIPLIVTSIFGVWCHHRFNRVALHGSLHDQYAVGSKTDEIPVRYSGLYRHPGTTVPTYEDLSGMTDPQDVYEDEQEEGIDTASFGTKAGLNA